MKKTVMTALFIIISLIIPQVSWAERFPDFTKLVEKVQPSVVSIKVDVKKRGRAVGKAGGSGFIVDPQGYILTNHHVVADSDKVMIKLGNKREYEAEVIGSDEGSDIALLKIDGKKLNLKALQFGPSNNLKVGEWVLAFGAPFNLEQTVTAGIVSAKGRGEIGSRYVPFIQTDVAINSGNSGGPLINLDGRVVGINSMILNPMISSGLSFSIPSDLVISIRQQLQNKGRVIRGFLGVGYDSVDQDAADALELEDVRGAIITSVQKGSPADKAGLQFSDVVIDIDGQKVNQSQDLPYIIGQMKPEDKARIKIVRKGKFKTLVATLGEYNAPGIVAASQNNALGISVKGLTDEQKESIGVDRGVVISEVEQGSAAQRAGLRQGDILQRLHRTNIEDIEDYHLAVANLPENRKIAALIARPGRGSDFVVIELQ